MYIVFTLPSGGGGAVAGHALWQIKQEVEKWAMQYGVQYSQKTIKYTHRLGFNKDEHFTLFSMTWNPLELEKRSYLKFQIVNIENEKY